MKIERHNITEATIAAAIILGPAIAIGIIADAKAGSIAEWVAAIATLGALLAALYAGRQAAKIVQVEQKRDADRDQERRREQAEQIAAWGTRGTVFILNSSNAPIYNVRVFAEFAGQHSADQISYVPPTPRQPPRVDARDAHTKYVQVLKDLQGKLERYPRMAVSIEFNDAANTPWRRDARGNLTELKPYPRDT